MLAIIYIWRQEVHFSVSKQTSSDITLFIHDQSRCDVFFGPEDIEIKQAFALDRQLCKRSASHASPRDQVSIGLPPRPQRLEYKSRIKRDVLFQ